MDAASFCAMRTPFRAMPDLHDISEKFNFGVEILLAKKVRRLGKHRGDRVPSEMQVLTQMQCTAILDPFTQS